MEIVAYTICLYTTLACNFKCLHCMRGDATSENISEAVLEELFRKVKVIYNLKLTGGEPFYNLQGLRACLDILKKNHVLVLKLSLTTNGSLYNPLVKETLDAYAQYISDCRKKTSYTFLDNEIEIILSNDYYHKQYMEKIFRQNSKLYDTYQENMKLLLSSPYFFATQELTDIWNVGKAQFLNNSNQAVVNYQRFYWEDIENNIMWVGPILNILTDGTLTELNGSIIDLKTTFNYGNILTSNIIEIIKANSQRCLTFENLNERCFTEIEQNNKSIPSKQVPSKRFVNRK